MTDKRQILLCVAGGTPQIITETLWALMQPPHNVHVDEIRVITTLEGRDKILTGKINGRGSADESLLDKSHGQFFRFLRDYPAAGKIKFDDNCLYILTTKHIGEQGFVGLDEITERDLARVCELFVKTEEGTSAIDEFRAMQSRANFIDSFTLRGVKAKLLDEKRRNYRKYNLSSARDAKVTTEEATAEVLQSYRETLDRITERLVQAKIDSKFDITRKGAKGGYIFGLETEGKRIEFE